MKKVVRKIMGMAMAAALLVGVPEFTTLAAEDTENGGITETSEVEVLEAQICGYGGNSEIMPIMLTQCIISTSADSEGMHIVISTGSVGFASVLGVKDIKIYKKVWYGWSLVATSSGGEVYDHSMMGVSILYANAVKDATYRITCYHYGTVYGEEEGGTNDTGAFVFTY